MTGRPDTWMPLYIGDYIADTMHLTTLQHGAYLLLIMAYWRRGGPIPNDDDYLKGVTRYRGSVPWSYIRSVIDSYFTIDGDSLRHKRIDEEILRSSQAYERLSAAGKRGHQQRMLNQGYKQPQSHPSLEGGFPNGKGKGNGSYRAPPSDTDDVEMRAQAKGIAMTGRASMGVSEHRVKQMVKLGYLTADQARKAGYAP